MKKILILIGDYNIPHHVLNFALQLRDIEPCKINGVFIGSLRKDSDTYLLPGDINLTDTDLTTETESEVKEMEAVQINVFKST